MNQFMTLKTNVFI